MFMYISHHAANTRYHTDLHIPKSYLRRFKHFYHNSTITNIQKFAALMAILDDSIGKLVKELQRNNILQNSFIVFTTDNGAHDQFHNNHPFKGKQNELWEGSIRGTAFIWTTERKKGYTSNQLMHITDWLPTLLQVAKYPNIKFFSLESQLDGFKQWWDLMRGKESDKRLFILLNIDPITKLSGYRYKNWKLLLDTNSESTSKRNDRGRQRIFEGFNGTIVRSSLSTLVEEFNQPTVDCVLEMVTNNYTQFLNSTKPELRDILKQLRQIFKRNAPFADMNELESDAAKCLHLIGRRFEMRPLLIDCKNIEPNNITCNNGGCLFDLESDPCERRNVANENKKIMKFMLNKLRFEKISNRYIKPINRNSEPRSWPIYYSRRWIHWGDDSNYKYNITTNSKDNLEINISRRNFAMRSKILHPFYRIVINLLFINYLTLN
ncbi:DgyrCDS13972 [Dimorphilus gyrociliatus]|nr:DgyrCDS13972 [Dimorphilus gyrociliatus]